MTEEPWQAALSAHPPESTAKAAAVGSPRARAGGESPSDGESDSAGDSPSPLAIIIEPCDYRCCHVAAPFSGVWNYGGVVCRPVNPCPAGMVAILTTHCRCVRHWRKAHVSRPRNDLMAATAPATTPVGRGRCEGFTFDIVPARTGLCLFLGGVSGSWHRAGPLRHKPMDGSLSTGCGLRYGSVTMAASPWRVDVDQLAKRPATIVSRSGPAKAHTRPTLIGSACPVRLSGRNVEHAKSEINMKHVLFMEMKPVLVGGAVLVSRRGAERHLLRTDLHRSRTGGLLASHSRGVVRSRTSRTTRTK